MHEWHGEPTDGPEGGCDFWKWLQRSPLPQLQDVVQCSEVPCNCSCSRSLCCSVVDVVEVVML